MSVADRNPGDLALARVRSLARELDPEPEHAFQVCRIALELHDATLCWHGLEAPARRLLAAGALLHDIGHARDPSGHHKHSRDMILEASLDGFSSGERRMIACIARYHRKRHPAPGHKVYRDLQPAQRGTVDWLAGLLRVADGLDRAHACATRRVRAERVGDAVRLLVEQRHSSPLDIWGALRKRGLLEECLGLRVEVVPHAR